MTIATTTRKILAKILLASVGIGSVVVGVISTTKLAEARNPNNPHYKISDIE